MKNVLTIVILIGLILLSGAGTYVAVNYQSLFPPNYLTIDYFGGVAKDAQNFNGITLPFSEEIKYTAKEIRFGNFVYLDFKFPVNTVIAASMPGNVTNIINSVNFSAAYIYIKHPTSNLYSIYTISNTTSNTVSVHVGDSVQRGGRIAVARSPLVIENAEQGTMLRLGVAKVFSYTPSPVPVELYLKNNQTSDYWASGEPKYFRSQ